MRRGYGGLDGSKAGTCSYIELDASSLGDATQLRPMNQ